MALKKQKPVPNADATASDAPAAEDMSGLGRVVIRNEFYRDGYRSLLRLCLLEGAIIMALLGAMYFVIHASQAQDRYFATTEDGRLIPMVALSEPNLSTPALMSWVAQSSTEVMTFGFNDYRRRLQESSRNFTRRGGKALPKRFSAQEL